MRLSQYIYYIEKRKENAAPWLKWYYFHIAELSVYIDNNEKYQNYIHNVTGNITTGMTETFGYDGHIKLIDTGEILKRGILTVRLSFSSQICLYCVDNCQTIRIAVSSQINANSVAYGNHLKIALL